MSSGGEGSQQQRHRRADVLAAATDLASLEGLEQLSMRDLAAMIGMSKSGLYAHFESKETLQLAIVGRAREVFEAHVLRNPAGPEGGLGALLERWLGFYERKVFRGGCFFVVAAVEFAGRRGPVREALEDALDLQIAALRTTVRRAQENGELDGGKDARQAAYELYSILMNTQALYVVKNDRTVFDMARAAIQNLGCEVSSR